MKLYVVNHFVGGTPMDGETVGVFDTLSKAEECLKKTIEHFGMEKRDIKEQCNDYVYWDADDFWGGLDITVMYLNTKYNRDLKQDLLL